MKDEDAAEETPAIGRGWRRGGRGDGSSTSTAAEERAVADIAANLDLGVESEVRER